MGREGGKGMCLRFAVDYDAGYDAVGGDAGKGFECSYEAYGAKRRYGESLMQGNYCNPGCSDGGVCDHQWMKV